MVNEWLLETVLLNRLSAVRAGVPFPIDIKIFGLSIQKRCAAYCGLSLLGEVDSDHGRNC
jgi:hypothetical protein